MQKASVDPGRQKTGYARDDDQGLPTWNTRHRAGTADNDSMVTVRLRSLPTSYHLMLLAYIDTALGSMLLQAMAGMIFAAIVMGRRILAAPLAWMSSRDSAQELDSEAPEIAESPVDS